MRAITLKEVIIRTSLRKSAIYAKIAAGTFPQPAKLGGGTRSAWLENEIDEWVAGQFAERDASKTRKG